MNDATIARDYATALIDMAAKLLDVMGAY